MRNLAILLLLAALVSGCSSEPAPPSAVSPEPPPATAASTSPPPPLAPTPAPEPAPPEANRTDRIQALLAEAQSLVQEGDRVTARERLDQALTLAAGHADHLAAVAAATLDLDYHQAVEIARQALALQPGHPRASLVLGTGLQLLDDPQAALPHLEEAYAGTDRSLAAGLELALALESLGQPAAARNLLTELEVRFPDRPEVAGALARLDSLLGVWPVPGTPETPAATWATERWRLGSDLLVGWRQDQKGLIALGRDGTIRWEMDCGGETILGFIREPAGGRAIAFTPQQGCLIDVTTGQLLAHTPPTTNTLWGFAWRGDYLAFSQDITPTGLPEGVAAYFGTNWQVYQITGAGGQVSLQHLYTAHDGSRTAALSRDGRILFTWMGNHGAGRPRLFVDGQMVTDYATLNTGAEFALDPRDDRFYSTGYDGSLQARTLDGELLWQQSGLMTLPVHLWIGDQGQVWVVAKASQEGFHVYDDQGQRLWSGPGWPAPGTARYLLARQPRETWLLNREGQIVARYPHGTFFTADGHALARKAGNRFLLYRPPG